MKTYGLIGYPLGHSFSANYFSEKFQRKEIDAQYLNFEMQNVENLRKLIEEDETICGLNVTIPHKKAVIPMLDALSPEAKEIGAVNVIHIKREDEKIRLTGHNSDVIGFTKSIHPLLQKYHHNALILGTGGASLAIAQGLTQLGIDYRIVSRSPKPDCLTYDELTEEIIKTHQVIVNCSPKGMFPHIDEHPDIPYQFLTNEHLLYDLVYNPTFTRFMQLGEMQGAIVKNGLEMLHLQAEAAWGIWNKYL